MTQAAQPLDPDAPAEPGASIFDMFAGLDDLAARIDDLDDDLAGIGDGAHPAIAAAVLDLRQDLRAFEPTVTMIGQVKAGKTTLVNAMVGSPGLLPADVNPWTSVVTALHLQPDLRPSEQRSAFRFFSNEEWDRLITRGGRVGELANRAGAEDELAKVRAQLDEMRAKSRRRLGRKFEMLLGQTHEYDMMTEALIERYVCMGDDFWEDDANGVDQGRYADITRSADLWIGKPDLPVNLCIQDTPGVNDTFMIREQITINALRGAKLCVMVLSAQQALSSVDMGLIRLVSNVRSRDLVIFVNRIDELADPVREVPQIEASIRATLRKFDAPTEAEILFGSGYWAQHAIEDTLHDLGEDSAEALLDWAEAQLPDSREGLDPLETVWHLSGLPALGDAIAQRIAHGAGARLVERTCAARDNLLRSQEAGAGLAIDIKAGVPAKLPAPQDLAAWFREAETRLAADLDARIAAGHAAFLSRVDRAHRTFLDRATAALVQHLDAWGQDDIWTYDPTGLRMLLRSAYQVFVRATAEAGEAALHAAAQEISGLYRDQFGMGGRAPAILPPPLPSADPPIALGQTIALDLRGTWWTRFWRKRRGHQALCDDFARLIHEETAPIVETLRRDNAEAFAAAVRAELFGFLATQRGIVTGLADESTPPRRTERLASEARRDSLTEAQARTGT
ncbi:dynamin family protein [Thetidibacter halocola]|uniref:Dynamin family protein n=1 Tax=Thetidibacter halocola TaxID=2827239 RepID=A0A8J8B666_9RHOB|nr:dynamin family protein [Thetidibacter halocola]MBS0123691.1 dynamin family protein [Thetidibacter halocola]